MIRVLVVDDSVVIRRLIVDALSDAPNIEVVGTASNGLLAQAKIDQLRPDVVTMDIEMPQMDGISAIRELRKRHPRLPVIMFSTLSASGASATLEALAAGATDYVTKPSNVGSIAESIAAVRGQMIPKIVALAGPSRRPPGPPPRPVPARPGPPPPKRLTGPARPAGAPADQAPAGRRRVELIAVGSSTGGPDALTKMLRSLPADLPVPMVVTQHMPPVFTKMFADRLDRSTPLTVVEAKDGLELAAGTAYIAPGDWHLTLHRRGTAMLTHLNQGPPENSCRPAVDVMFRSVAAVYGGSALAVVLTGMGQDGRTGAKALRDAGAEIVAQDERSSVVWGMPGAVVAAGLANEVLPLDQIASFVIGRVRSGRSAAVAR